MKSDRQNKTKNKPDNLASFYRTKIIEYWNIGYKLTRKQILKFQSLETEFFLFTNTTD